MVSALNVEALSLNELVLTLSFGSTPEPFSVSNFTRTQYVSPIVKFVQVAGTVKSFHLIAEPKSACANVVSIAAAGPPAPPAFALVEA